VATGTGT